jgi:hypothetical protein
MAKQNIKIIYKKYIYIYNKHTLPTSQALDQNFKNADRWKMDGRIQK